MLAAKPSAKPDRPTPERVRLVREELDLVNSSDAFAGSKRCQEFLRLVVGHALAGEYDALRERMIGAEMFGRSVDYDTSNDAVVRVRATEVRKRLAQHYSEAQPSIVRIELPPGSYEPQFQWQSPQISTAESTAGAADSVLASRPLRAHWKTLRPAALALVALLAIVWYFRTPKTQEITPVRLSLGLPEGVRLQRSWHPFEHFALSPDGSTLTFAATDSSGQSFLWVRPLSSPEAKRLDQTEGALLPFWSPDSQFIGFWARGKLRKIRPSGGTPDEIYSVPEIAQGAWGPDGSVLFARAVNSPIFRISPNGDRATRVTSLLADQVSQMWVQFLPDGKHFLYLARTSLTSSDPSAKVYVESLDGGTSVPLLSSPSRVVAVPDYLLFVRDQTLMAQRMDWEKLRKLGTPQVIAQGIAASLVYLATSQFTASQNGVLVYGTGEGAPFDQLNWYRRDGSHLASLDSSVDCQQFTLSPNGRYLALQSFQQHATGSLWLLDVASNSVTPLTMDPRAQSDPVWSPDSRYVAFDLLPNGGANPPFMARKMEIGTQQSQPVYGDDQERWVEDWSPDGRFLLTHNSKTLSLLPTVGETKPSAIYSTPFAKDEFHVSPDGRKIAWGENRTGRWEVFVALFPSFKNIKQVSAAGGAQPRWRGDGHELFYIDLDGNMMSASVEPGQLPRTGIPGRLFATSLVPDPTVNQYAVTADGHKFLILEPRKGYLETYSVVLNWPAVAK